ncbi:MAG: hypothetical protein QXD66_06455 [Candidatus Nezhaarchaeales archaeon]|nr:MAG: hypothetical protein DSO06_05150 [Candidatus Nezhaarchaeota archaeon WYZ-LMO8]TDA36647.1 MAG: hypothetical protein DSO05_02920 [Candidatus Nezhaarchaeota archaeon WYZ-LMO7]
MEGKSRENVVVDANVLLMDNVVQYLQKYRCFTIPEVIDEIKTIRHKVCVEVLLDLKVLNVINPDRSFIDKVLEIARRSGDISSLSRTDLKVLALALQLHEQGLDPLLMTDDYTVQNLASRLNLRWRNVKIDAIKRRIRWRYLCTACGEEYSKYLEECRVCGHRLRREVAGYEEL